MSKSKNQLPHCSYRQQEREWAPSVFGFLMTLLQTALSPSATFNVPFLSYSHLNHYEIRWAYQCSWIWQSASSTDVWIQPGNLGRKVSQIPFTNPVLLSCLPQKPAHWWSRGKKGIMQHMRAPHTSKHMWTGLVPKLGGFLHVWLFWGWVSFVVWGFFVAVYLFYFFNMKGNFKWKDYWRCLGKHLYKY